MYVIVRDTDGLYVAAYGESSYTDRLELAQRFDTHADADRNRCVENETVVPMFHILQPVR